MFFFEGYLIMFLTATPLAFILVFNRKNLNLPRYVLALAFITLLAAIFVFIGFAGIIFGGSV